MNRSLKILGVVAGAVFVSTLTACGDKAVEPFHDAPRSDTTNREPADVVEFPDGFSNLATKCDNGNRVYSTYHGDAGYAAIAVVPDAEGC